MSKEEQIPTIGEVVRTWREFRGLKLTELANRAQVRKGYLSELEHNKIDNPKQPQLEKLAGALQISVKDILARRLPTSGSSGQVHEEDWQGDFTFSSPLPVIRGAGNRNKELYEILAHVDELRSMIQILIEKER